MYLSSTSPDDETTTAEASESQYREDDEPTLARLARDVSSRIRDSIGLSRSLLTSGHSPHPSRSVSPLTLIRIMPPPAQTTDVKEFAARVQKAATAHSVNAHEFGKNIYDTLRITEVKLEDEDGAMQQEGKVTR